MLILDLKNTSCSIKTLIAHLLKRKKKEKATARLAEGCCFLNASINRTGALWIQGHFITLEDRDWTFTLLSDQKVKNRESLQSKTSEDVTVYIIKTNNMAE